MSIVQRVVELPVMAPRLLDAHKGDFGRVLIVAGSRGMSGAAVLSGSAALRGGAGLVTVACPEIVWPIVAAGNPGFMTLPLPDEAGRLHADALVILQNSLTSFDVVIVGPGLGQSSGVVSVVGRLLATSKQTIVVDADGLNALGCPPDVLRNNPGPRILTPHPGEMARLIDSTAATVQQRREELTADFAGRFGVTLVLKGNRTLVSDGKQLFENTTGNPGMATAGAGDVLSGLIGALLGQRLPAFAAGQLGVHLHGLAGDLARDALGEVSLMATDLLDYLPQAFRTYAAAHGC